MKTRVVTGVVLVALISSSSGWAAGGCAVWRFCSCF